MSLQEVMSGGNGDQQAANPTSQSAAESGGKGAERAPNPINPNAAPANSSEPSSGPARGSEAGGQNITLAPWATQLPKDIRENPEYAQKLAGFAKLEDFAKSYFQMEGTTAIPGEQAPPEELAAFWRKLGHPEKPDGYTVAKDPNTAAFVSAAHAARLTDAQASAFWKQVSEDSNRQLAVMREAQQRELMATDAALQKEFGDKYEYALQMFQRGIGDGEVKALVMQSGLAGKPEIVKAFIALGEARQESGSPKSGTPAGGKDYMNGSWYD